MSPFRRNMLIFGTGVASLGAGAGIGYEIGLHNAAPIRVAATHNLNCASYLLENSLEPSLPPDCGDSVAADEILALRDEAISASSKSPEPKTEEQIIGADKIRIAQRMRRLGNKSMKAANQNIRDEVSMDTNRGNDIWVIGLCLASLFFKRRAGYGPKKRTDA